MNIRFPDYENGIVNLACSILKHYGAKYTHPTLPVFDELLQKDYKNVVVLVLDGMGIDALQYHLPDGSFLRRHFVTEISSVFPPTTTAAVTSIESGLTPAEHGWIGWCLYFRELDKLVNIFPNTIKFTKEQAADYHVASKHIPYKSIYDKINEAGKAKAYSVSKFGSNRIATFEEMTDEVQRLCNLDDRKYIYAYWEDPDYSMHELGCYDSAVTSWLKEADDKLEQMCTKLKDTLVIVLADHGHINLSYYILSDFPELVKMMERATTIESRAACFYIKKEFRNQFAEEFYKIFGNDFKLFSKQEVMNKNLFGDGEVHHRFEDFIGDFIAVAIKDKGIVNKPESQQLASNHAGLTEQEMKVPFISIEIQ